jgi:hypothetical protein
LSGGERQRISIARAFIKNAPILIMDEPTSSIDSRTESVILDALDELMVGRTSFLIAHRLATIRGTDLVLVLDHGEVIEQGTHDELLANDGLYRQLYEAQTLGRGARPSLEPHVAQAQLTEGAAEQGRRDRLRAVPGGKSENGHRRGKGAQKLRSERPPPMKRLGVRADVVCDLCGRVLLTGEPVILFMAPGAGGQKPRQERKRVCELCAPTAEDAGWKAPPAIRQRQLLESIDQAQNPDGPPASSLTDRGGMADADQ